MTYSLFDLTGKVALVTGASRGLGQYFARALARAGADLAMTSRDKSALSGIANEIGGLGRHAFCAELDVRDHTSIQQAIAAIEEHFGKIDILVNNAGCNIRKPALEVSWDDWNRILDTTAVQITRNGVGGTAKNGALRGSEDALRVEVGGCAVQMLGPAKRELFSDWSEGGGWLERLIDPLPEVAIDE